jgi:DNA-binding SARP family transcriptional activator
MQLQLLGGFALIGAGADAQPVSLRRGQALLAYLALKETRAESREVLLDLLWPDRFKEQAQASLRQVLFELRAAAGEGPAIVEATRTSVALGAGIADCDVWEFESLPSRDTGLGGVEHMLRLYRGPLLDGPPIGSEPFGQWMAIQRARLEGRLESAVLEATARSMSADEQERAMQALQRLIELSPMCGQAVLRLMSIEAAAGRGQEALRQYERHAKRLKLEFDEEPPAELRQAYEAIKAAPQQIKVPAISLAPARIRARRPVAAHARRCAGAGRAAVPLRGAATVGGGTRQRAVGRHHHGAVRLPLVQRTVARHHAQSRRDRLGLAVHRARFRAPDGRRLPDLWSDRRSRHHAVARH